MIAAVDVVLTGPWLLACISSPLVILAVIIIVTQRHYRALAHAEQEHERAMDAQRELQELNRVALGTPTKQEIEEQARAARALKRAGKRSAS